VSFWQEVLSNVIAYAVVVVVAWAVVVALIRFRPDIRGRLWPLPRLRPGRWSGFEVFLAFVLMAQVGDLVRQVLSAAGFYESLFAQPPSPGREALWATPLYFFLTLALILGITFGMSRTRPSHVGLSWARWPQSVILGVTTFTFITPIVLAIYALAVSLLPVRPHDLELIAKEGLWPAEWALLAFQACVAAPILEELFFRGLLQGWLRRASVSGHVMVCIWTVFFAAFPLIDSWQGTKDCMPLESAWQPLALGVCFVAWYAWRFFQVWGGVLREGPLHMMNATSADAFSLFPKEDAATPELDLEQEPAPVLQIDPQRWRDFQVGNIRLAILGSSMFFAVAHSMAWPSPIPLFLLALVLGRLAQRSQNLIGPVVLHACFNAVAFGSLLYVHSLGGTNGNAETVAARPSVGGKTVAVVPASQNPRFK